MPQDLADALWRAVTIAQAGLEKISDDEAAAKPRPGAWSRKEELGHLIDSATNNHVRFVRATLEPEFRGPTYDGDGWVRVHHYADLPWATLVNFWRDYNRFLADLVAGIPEDQLETPCTVAPHPAVTLRFLIDDYRLHMQHHLDHILGSHTAR